MSQADIDVSMEILVLGQSAVGKTNLITRFTFDEFSESARPTIGNDYFKTVKAFNDMKTMVKFWDTAGQERFNAITNTFFHNADGVILVYDTTNRESFDKVQHWLAEARANCKKQVAIMLVGNKNDLFEAREVSIEEARTFAETQGLLFFETSAKTNKDNCVHQAFQALIEQRIEPLYKEQLAGMEAAKKTARESLVKINAPEGAPKKKGCC